MSDSTRIPDIFLSLFALLVLLPLLVLIALIIKITSKGPVFFVQKRVGKNNSDFYIYKFRTMNIYTGHSLSLTVGSRDSRITAVGYYLRKYKLDELPQLYNVLKGEMSIVGPRPELRKYVNMYNEEQKKVLTVRPGITDYASIKFKNESDMLLHSKNPEEYYISKIMPIKIELNKVYINNKCFWNYFSIIFNTVISTKKAKLLGD